MNISMAAMASRCCFKPDAVSRRCASLERVGGDAEPYIWQRLFDPELEELTMDAWRALERIGFIHLADQISDLPIDAGPTETAGSRSPPPVEPGARSMLLDDSCRLHQHHDLEALRPESV